MSGTNGSRGSTPVERWVQHLAQAISVAAVIGGAILLSDLRTTMAVVDSRMEALSEDVQEMRKASEDRYTATQAAKDFRDVSKRYDDHENRIRNLESYNMRKNHPE